MIVTIDGPAGAGKSTVARGLAERLGIAFLDTGAMYRAVTFAALRSNVAADDSSRLAALLDGLAYRAEGDRVYLGDEDITAEIRTPAVTNQVRFFADQATVRERLVDWQRELAQGRDLVTEGRDQGTIVFPHAACKFFVTASEAIRAQRRQADFAAAGRDVPLEEVLDEQRQRDEQDQTRALAPLVPAVDAIVIDTTGIPLPAVLDRLEEIVRNASHAARGDDARRDRA